MAVNYPKFEISGTEPLAPNEKKAGEFFSRLAYRIPDAIADLVDNSVDAKARHVLVRFVRTAGGIHSVLIVDDGEGMNATELREAMRFGSDVKTSGKQLGKYGIGLKTASLSQAEVVTVLSRQKSSYCGRRWSLENIKSKWKCEILRDDGVREAFQMDFGQISASQSGTLIIWERLEHLRALPQNLDKVMEKTIGELSIELGIRFHRFLENDRLTIAIDQQFAGEEAPKVHREVTPLNPFSYPTSGHQSYPLTLKMNVSGVKVAVRCHIWPAQSKGPGYRLGGGKVAMRQGFYFYRNDRVIQAGGWNGLRADDGEPHLSLARVEIDLPSELDSMFKLDVAKSHLDPSPQFFQELQRADTKGCTFSKYLEQAQSAYRKQKTKEAAKFPYVPASGLPAAARKAIAQILTEKGTGKPKRVGFKWVLLDHDEVFRIDAIGSQIALNTRYKKDLTEGGSDDAPVLKLALLFLLQSELDKAFHTKATLTHMQRINQAFIASMKGR